MHEINFIPYGYNTNIKTGNDLVSCWVKSGYCGKHRKKTKIKIEIKMLQTVNVQHNNFTVSHNSITNI